MTGASRGLFLAGSCLYLLMGLSHIAVVLWDNRRGRRLFLPADEDLRRTLKGTTLPLCRRLSVIALYNGLDLSHGLGVAVFGLIATYLVLKDFGGLSPDVFILTAIGYCDTQPDLKSRIVPGSCLISLSRQLRAASGKLSRPLDAISAKEILR